MLLWSLDGLGYKVTETLVVCKTLKLMTNEIFMPLLYGFRDNEKLTNICGDILHPRTHVFVEESNWFTSLLKDHTHRHGEGVNFNLEGQR